MSVRCGNCQQHHDTSNDVRRCYGLVAGEGNDFDIPGYGGAYDDRPVYIGPARPTPEVKVAVTVTEGMWKLNDRIIKIQKAVHGNGNLYGKELFVNKYTTCGCCGCEPQLHTDSTMSDTAPPCDGCNYCLGLDEREIVHHYFQKIVGAVKLLERQGGRKMTLEEAEEFGALYGFCCRCGRTLTDENSIEAGIGPVCAGKFEA